MADPSGTVSYPTTSRKQQERCLVFLATLAELQGGGVNFHC